MGGLNTSRVRRWQISGTDGNSAAMAVRRRLGQRTRFVRFAPSRSAQIGGQFGEERGGCHAQAHMAMPSVPRANLTMIKAEIVFGALETFLDGPTQSSSTGEFGKSRACRREDEVVGALIGGLTVGP